MKFMHHFLARHLSEKVNKEILPEGIAKVEKPRSFLEKEVNMKDELEEKADDLQYRISELKNLIADLKNKKNTNSNLLKSLDATKKELNGALNYFHDHHEEYAQVSPDFYKTVQQLKIAQQASENLQYSKEETPEAIDKNIQSAQDEIAKCEELVIEYQRLAMGISNVHVDGIKAQERGGVNPHLN